MNTIQIFQSANNLIDGYLKGIIATTQSGWVAGITDITTVSVSIYVLVYGYMVLAGKIQTPIPDLVWNMARFAFILAVINNQANILTLSVDAVDGLKSFLAGSDNLYLTVDDTFNTIINDIRKIWDKASKFTPLFQAILQITCYSPLIASFTIAGALILVSDVVTKILLATAPIFLFCLMWGFLRDSFNRWLSTILGNLFVIMFTVLLMKFSLEILHKVQQVSHDPSDIFLNMGLTVVLGLLNIAMVKWGREMALSLANVTAAAAGGGIASGTRDAARSTYNLSRAAVSGSVDAAKTAGNLTVSTARTGYKAGKIGYRVGRAIQNRFK